MNSVLKSIELQDDCVTKHIEEDRGILTDIKKLAGKFEKPEEYIRFFLNIQEFLFLYAIFEDIIKDLVREHKEDPKLQINEKKIVSELIVVLKTKEIFSEFVSSLKEKSCEVITTEYQLLDMWTYFTQLRHLYAHSAGMVTSPFLNNINKIQDKVTIFENKNMEWKYYLDESELPIFDFDFKENEIYQLKDYQLHFFRNLVVCIMETIDLVWEKQE